MDPVELLVEPREPAATIGNGFANPIDVLNYSSPSAWLNEIICGLTDVDVMGWLTEWVTGDWAAVWKFGDAMAALADFMQQAGINVQQGLLTLDESWDGNAEDAAYQYFSRFAAAISVEQIALRNKQDRYHRAALGAWELANRLGNILQALADKAVLAGISVAAGTVLAETGVGAVAGYGAAALIALDMLELINTAAVAINTTATVVLGLVGAGMDISEQAGQLSTIALPDAPYPPPGG